MVMKVGTKTDRSGCDDVAYAHRQQCVPFTFQEDWKRLRDLGHWGCSVEHYVFDRAGLVTLDRMIRQWHEATPYSNMPDDMVEVAVVCLAAITTDVVLPCYARFFGLGHASPWLPALFWLPL